jgi:hypothetical protein
MPIHPEARSAGTTLWPGRSRDFFSGWGWALPAAALFILGGVTAISEPGVYMDAVNPDYTVVSLLNPRAQGIPGWYLPGNLLFGRFLILGNVYYGALPLYVGLPAYALFGTGVVGIRVTNIFFGLLVLAGTALFLRTFRVRPAIAGLCLAALALDPGFLFSFRTQFYITLLPDALLLTSVALTERGMQGETRPRPAVAGLLAGAACYGYFIYAFMAPAAFLHATGMGRRDGRPGIRPGWWVAGFAAGVSPYLLSLILLTAATGGFHAAFAYLTAMIHGLGVESSSMTLGQRLGYFVYLVRGTLFDAGPSVMILGNVLPVYAPWLKVGLLLVLPLAMLLLTLISRKPTCIGLSLIAGMILGSLALTIAFGNRLWLHHAIVLLPLLYSALALALESLGNQRVPRLALIAALTLSSPLLLTNAIDRQAVFQQLRVTGGVGLYSDALTRFAADSLRLKNVLAFFPDWGVFMPFVMLTHGNIPYWTSFDVDSARSVLCGGRAVMVALVAADGSGRLDSWSAALGWGAPTMRVYRQFDGKPVLVVGLWDAAARPPDACPR